MVRKLSMKRKRMSRRMKSKYRMKRTKNIIRKNRSRKVGGGCGGSTACSTQSQYTVHNLVFKPQSDNLSTWDVMNGAKIERHIDASTSAGFKVLIENDVNDSGDNSLMSWFDTQYMPANVSEDEKSKFDVVLRLDIEISNPFKLDESQITFSSLHQPIVVSPLLYLLIISCIGNITYEKSIIWLINHYSLMRPRCIQKTPGISRDSALPEDSANCYPQLYFIGEMLKRCVSKNPVDTNILNEQLYILMLLLSKDQLLLERFDYDSTTKLHALTSIGEALQQFNQKKLQSSFSATLSKISKIHTMMNEINEYKTTHNLTEEKLSTQEQVLPDMLKSEITRMVSLSREINHDAKKELDKMEQDRIAKEQIDRDRQRDLDAFKLAQQENDVKEAVRIDFAQRNKGRPVVNVEPAQMSQLQQQYVLFLQGCKPNTVTKLDSGKNLYTELMELYEMPSSSSIKSYVQTIQLVDIDFLMAFKYQFCRENRMGFAFLINETNSHYMFQISHVTEHNASSDNRPILLLPEFVNDESKSRTLNEIFKRYNMIMASVNISPFSKRTVNHAGHYNIYKRKFRVDSPTQSGSVRLFNDTGFNIYLYKCGQSQ